jgi:hypothetical protein
MKHSSMIARFLVLALLSPACKGAASDSEPAAAADQGKGEAGGAQADSSPEPAANLPSAQDVLARAVEAVGGKAKLDAVTSFYYRGQVSIMGQNMGGPIEIWWKDGDFYTTQDMTGVGQIRAGKQGDTIWSQDPINGLRKLAGTEAEQHLWASSVMLAADWEKYFTGAKTVGEREEDGSTLYDIELTSESGAKITMSFDKDTGLQAAQTYQQVTPMGPMPVSVKMEDYRSIEPEGIKIAFRQVTDASLMKATQQIDEIRINVDVDTARFAMPTGGAEVVRPEADPTPERVMPFDEDGKPGKPVPTK